MPGYENSPRFSFNRRLSTSVGPSAQAQIKDHMERSGMRWTEAMAEAIVKLRAMYLSGDFDQYWPFHIQKTGNASIRMAGGASSKVFTPNSFHGLFPVYCCKVPGSGGLWGH